MAALYLEKEFGIPYVDTIPMGVMGMARCIRQIQKVLNGALAKGWEKVEK